MHELTLTGLDGSNPLGFLAALGTLACLPPSARLRWTLDGVWRPVLHSEHETIDSLAAALDEARSTRRESAALQFSYSKKGKVIADVKAPPARLRRTLLEWLGDASPTSRRDLDWFTSFVSEGSVDGNGMAKPTPLHFAAGQQQFLKAASQLADETTQDDLNRALTGPWPYDSKLPVMGWDNTETRDYALRASDPSSDKKLGNPGADWLALCGLELLPTVAERGKQRVAGSHGGWKTGGWVWPLWDHPAALPTVRSLLATRSLRTLPAMACTRRGICQVYSTRILRSDQGGYGSVSPAQAV